MKASTEAVAVPGAASGRAIRQNAPKAVSPSVRAASSSSTGSPSKNPIIIQRISGTDTDNMRLRISTV